jgi:hypothetical protein
VLDSIIEKDDPYVIEYGDVYIDKINYLKKLITEQETGKEVFKIVDFEAGLGKSKYTDLIIKDYLNEVEWTNQKKFLIVKRFNEDSINTANVLESGFLKNSTLAITSENWNNEWKDNLEDLHIKRVLIISHKRYVNLCLDDNIRKYFTKGRHTLIIDEKVMFPVYTYNDELYNAVHKIFPHALRDPLKNICQGLNNILISIKNNKQSNAVTRVFPKTKFNIESFNQLIEYNKHIFKTNKDKAIIEYFLEGLNLWYSMETVSIANAGNISTCNPKHQHWGLKNNIILDASAGIDGIYRANTNKYRLQRQTHFIDHQQSKFVRVDFNSSKTNINSEKNNYFPEMARRIVTETKGNEKTLIVIQKSLSDQFYKHICKVAGIEKVWKDKSDKKLDFDYNNEPFAIAWFGNLIGKNTFKDFNNIWILGSPNIPLEQYLIQYMHYSCEGIGRKGLTILKGRYKNSLFRSVQEGYIISELYQTLKRIQRNPKPAGKLFIVHHDEDIVNSVIGRIKNAAITETITLDFKQKEKEEKEKTKKQTKPELVRHYLLQQKSGTIISNEDLKKRFQITNMSKVINHHLLIELRPKYLNRIKIERNQIVVL